MASRYAGRYELRRRLGAGSIGVVYEALDPQRGTRVALKQLRPLVPAGAYRLQREFQVLRGLEHPNVVQYHELSIDETPAFIAMELIEGLDFVTYCRKRGVVRRSVPRPITDSLSSAQTLERDVFAQEVHEKRLRDALAQLVPAIHAIHTAGVVHRDLKPSNVLIENSGRVVVMDFSIATEARSYADEATSGGVIIGTPEYMAPEQAAGAPATPAADWYALGAMLYACMTGRLPFEGSWNRVVEDKQALSPVSPHELVAGIPEDLSTLCMALLRRHPEDRPGRNEIYRRLGLATRDGDAPFRESVAEAPLVARERPLASLREVWHAVVAGAGGWCLVTGDAGMGKTRFVAELVRQTRDATGGELVALQATCHLHDERCYPGLDDIVDQLSHALSALPREQLKAVLPVGCDLLARMFPVLLRVPGITRAPRRRVGNQRELRSHAAAVLGALLAQLASERPILLVLDDLHLADRDTIALFMDVFCAAPPKRVMVVATARAGESERHERSDSAHSTWADLGDEFRGRLVSIALEPLPRAAQEQLYRQMAKVGAEPDKPLPFRDTGTPLLLLERIHHVLAARADLHDEGAEHAPPEPGEELEGEQKRQILDMFKHRISALPGAARKLLHAIGLTGSPLPLPVLAKAVDQSVANRGKAVDALRTADLIREVGQGRGSRLTVTHEEIRVSALDDLPEARMRELNLRLAMALQRSGKVEHGLLGHRWQVAEDRERAFPLQELAAKHARDRFAFNRAAYVYRQALSALPPATAAAERLWKSWIDALVHAQQYHLVVDEYQAAFHGREPTLQQSLRLGDLALRAGLIGLAREHLRRCCQELGAPLSTGQSPGRLASWSRRTRIALVRRRSATREASEVPAVTLQRTDALHALAMMLLLIAPGESSNLQAEHLLQALRHGERKRVRRAHAGQTLDHLLQGAAPAAGVLQGVETSMADAEAHEDRDSASLLQLAAGLVLGWRESSILAEERLAQAIDAYTFDTEGAFWELATAQFLRCMHRIGQGLILEETGRIARILAQAERVGDLFSMTLFGTLPGMWRAMLLDDVEDSLQRLPQLDQAWRPMGSYLMRGMTQLALAMGHLYLGQAEPAATALGACREVLAGHRKRHYLLLEPTRLAVRGRLALLSDHRGAVGKVAAGLQRLGSPLGHGHASSLAAALAHREGSSQSAQEQLQSALRYFSAAGAEHLAMACRFRLGTLQGDTTGRELIAEAHRWSRKQGIINAPRMFDYLVPLSLHLAAENPTQTEPDGL